MANEVVGIPTNLITQVSKEEPTPLVDYSTNRTSIQTGHRSEDQQEQGTASGATSTPFKRRILNLFRSMCCCFCKSQRSGTAYRRDLTSSAEPHEPYLLPPTTPEIAGLKCLVLDLDETLVHSSFKPIPNPDFIIPVEIEDQVYKVYVVKRPGVDQFLAAMGGLFEVVVFTASLAKYADPVLDLLDKHKVVKVRLFRDACVNYKGNYVKDLGKLGREIHNVIIIDNSPSSYLFHPENAVPIDTWFDDENDTELLDLIPVLESLTKVDNVRTVLEAAKKKGGGKVGVIS